MDIDRPRLFLALKRVCDGSALPVMIELGNLATAIGHAARALPLCHTIIHFIDQFYNNELVPLRVPTA